jgi:hypothetical protein
MSRQMYQNRNQNRKDELSELLNKFKSGELEEEDLTNKLMIKNQLPSNPYFRTTRSRAIALYGVKKDPVVLYRYQWLRFSKVFSGGKDCTFNKFFFNSERTKENVSHKTEVKEFLKSDEKNNQLKTIDSYVQKMVKELKNNPEIVIVENSE